MFRLQAQPHLCWLVSVGGHQSPFSDSSFYLKMRIMAFSLLTSWYICKDSPSSTERWKLGEIFLVGSGFMHSPQCLLPCFLQARDNLRWTCSS